MSGIRAGKKSKTTVLVEINGMPVTKHDNVIPFEWILLFITDVMLEQVNR